MIRQATLRDVAQIAALEHACFEPRAWSAEHLVDSLSLSTRVAWICETGGYAMASTAGDVTDLERIAVAPGVRRRGTGRRLLDAVVEHAIARDARRVLLEVAAENEPALALYRAAGGERIDRRRDYYGRGRDALVLAIEVVS